MAKLSELNLDEFFKSFEDNGPAVVIEFRHRIDLWLIEQNKLRELEIEYDKKRRIEIMHEEYERIYGHKYGEPRVLKTPDEFDAPREDLIKATDNRLAKEKAEKNK